MKISITVKPNAKHESIEKREDGSYHVAVKSPPVEGQANQAVIKVLANYFSIPNSAIQIVKGLRGNKKIVELKSG